MMSANIKVIGFDADDTLWINEPFYQETEKKFCEIFSHFGNYDQISEILFNVEMQNLKSYGYGAKSFILSMIETAVSLEKDKIDVSVVKQIVDFGKQLINKPVVILPGVQNTLEKLHHSGYKLVLVTKGDLLDQERKLSKSQLENLFHHIEIMSEKEESNYLKLTQQLDILPNEFLMVGNSMKSDILPVVQIGGYAAYIPYHITWQHENATQRTTSENMMELQTMTDILQLDILPLIKQE
jgi:putative hydrolase of the HAD superfamily